MSKTKPQLRVISAKFRNILGIEEGALQPDGRAVLVSGRNASMKTSFLEATRAALGGGSLLKLAHVGAEEEPEVCIELAGNGKHYRIEKTGGETARVRARVGDTQAYEDVKRPQEFLSGLFDTKCANPVAFLTAPDKERATLLLQALPLRLDRNKLAALLGDHIQLVTGRDIIERANLHPLEELAAYREAIFDARTGVNRDCTQKRATAEQQKRLTPAVPPEDPGPRIVEGEAAIESLSAALTREREQADAAQATAIQEAQAKHNVEEEQISGAFRLEREQMRKAHDAQAAELRAEVERQIAALHTANEAAIAARQAQDEAKLVALDEQLESAKTAAADRRAFAQSRIDKAADELARTRESMATLRAEAETYGMVLARIQDAQRFEAEADELEEKGRALTGTLDRLDAFTRELAEELPIRGLSILGKEIRLDGVLFEQVNTAMQCKVAAKVAALRAAGNPLPLIFLDRLETLDTPSRTALLDELIDLGMQPFGARVTDGDLEVQYIGAVESLGAPSEPEPEPVGAGTGKAAVLPMQPRRRGRLGE